MENYYEINYEKNMQMLSQAIKYCEENFLHEDLINELYNDNDLKKQLCLIEIKKLNSQKEADILVENLTQHSGPIRETTSFKILELIKDDNFKHYFQTKQIINIFVKAITDINPGVSRNTVEIIQFVDNSDYIYSLIIKEIKETLSKMEDIKQTRSYNANKKNFNLYWNLEAIINIADKLTFTDDLLEILKETALSNDYTIREKTAKVAKKLSFQNKKFNSILKLLAEDTNIYVQKYL
jgi:hypothetical protein